jgi:hypothetical protein
MERNQKATLLWRKKNRRKCLEQQRCSRMKKSSKRLARERRKARQKARVNSAIVKAVRALNLQASLIQQGGRL